MKIRIVLAALVLGATAFASPARASDAPGRSFEWSSEILEVARKIPVQDDGRVKPLSTWARFTAMSAAGTTRIKTSIDEKKAETLDPTEWVLDCLLFPEVAASYPVFLVEDSEVLTDLGLGDVARKKRDRYGYDEIRPAADRLIEKARAYSGIDAKKRTILQGMTLALANDFIRIERLLHFLEFSLAPRLIERSSILALLPPSGSVSDAREWYSPASLAAAAAAGSRGLDHQIALAGILGSLPAVRHDPALLLARLTEFQDGAATLARARGEYDSVPLEVTYYRWDLLFFALLLFLGGFVTLSISWLRPAGVWLYRGSQGLLTTGAVLLTLAIVLRCVIRSRPPVTTLYESILFITATGVLIALAIEWMNRQRIAVVFAAALGAGGLFLARGYEGMEGTDTMPTLVAVLDTNFWLSTHVTAVTLGYCAGLLAAAIGHLYVFGKMFGLKSGEPQFYRNLSRMLYGVIAFGVIFSTVGTILGGIWANDSWGRFWGWDPKENGALMIVLWFLATIHARMGGYLKAYGIAVASMFGGIVVAFSWWGVNQLGVGLHSYGFTSGIARPLYLYYGVQAVLVGAAIVYPLIAGRRVRTGPPAA